MEHHELLARLSTTMREVIAPAVGDEYEKTQAFMVAVILDKVARDLAVADEHASAAAADVAALRRKLEPLVADAPAAVAEAVAALDAATGLDATRDLVDAMYAARDEWPSFPAARDRLRVTLRAALDRDLVAAS